MASPVLHLLAGPNGAGKSTFYEEVLATTGLPFVNADQIARVRWPEASVEKGYEAAKLAEQQRHDFISARRSFITETVFSHPSKLDLLRTAQSAGYQVYLHVLLIPEALAVRRVAVRVRLGGHDVPEEKIRGRFSRLWALVRQAIELADEAQVLDNSRAATPFRRVARFVHGELVSVADWPSWTPAALREE